jgi:ribosomal protein S12 methylthiotransferase accessory factor
MLDARHGHISTSKDVVTGLDHALYYVPPARAQNLDPLRSGAEPPAKLADLDSRYRQEPTLAGCVACLGDAGIRVAAVDVTSPDVALAPIRVVRAFGTHIQPIHFGAANRRLASPRLIALLTGSPETEPHPIA